MKKRKKIIFCTLGYTFIIASGLLWVIYVLLDAWGSALNIIGFVLFVLGVVFAIIGNKYRKSKEAAFYEKLRRKGEKRWKAAAKNDVNLPSNTIFLNRSYLTVGVFTSEGLRIEPFDEIFIDQSQIVPLEALKVYLATETDSPEEEGWEKTFLMVPDPDGEEDAARVLLTDRDLDIAKSFGVQVIDRRFHADMTAKVVQKKVSRSGHLVRDTILFVVGVILTTLLLILFGILSKADPTSISIMEAFLMTVFCYLYFLQFRKCKKIVVTFYENGVVFPQLVHLGSDVGSINAYLPYDCIERVTMKKDLLFIDVGYGYYFLPDSGLYKYLKEHFPEKCEE